MEQSVVFYDQYSKLLGTYGTHQALVNGIGLKSATTFLLSSKGIPIPESFAVTSDARKQFGEKDGGKISESLWQEIILGIKRIEDMTSLKFGGDKPLILSIRGDCSVYAPGIMYSTINIGFNDAIARSLDKLYKNRGFVYDNYRRFLQSFGSVVLGIPSQDFDSVLSQFCDFHHLKNTSEFSDIEWIEITKLYKSIIMRKTGKPFPQNPYDQLKLAISALFNSIKMPRVQAFQDFYKVSGTINYSLLVQRMIFGNNGPKSLSFVISSRDPLKGTQKLAGLYATCSLCGDVSNGDANCTQVCSISQQFLDVYDVVVSLTKQIEKIMEKPQTIDFSVENGRTYVVSSSPCLFSGTSQFLALRDMANSGVISKESALFALTQGDLASLSSNTIEKEPTTVLANGLYAGSAAVVGKLSFTPLDCIEKSKTGVSAILVKQHITPDDFPAVLLSSAVVSSDKGDWSFAAKICRFLKKPCVLEAEFALDSPSTVTFQGKQFKAGDTFTVSNNGKLFFKAQKLVPSMPSKNVAAQSILQWAEQLISGKFSILSHVQLPENIQQISKAVTDGIGLFPLDSLLTGKKGDPIKSFIETGKKTHLATLEKQMIPDIAAVLQQNSSVVIALLLSDSPINRFLPNICTLAEEISVLSTQKEIQDEEFKKGKELNAKSALMEIVKKHQENNTSFGLKGSRLYLQYPELLEVQINSIAKAIIESKPKSRIRIVVPNVMNANEIIQIRKIISPILLQVGVKIEIAASIETPSACYCSDRIAKEVDYLYINTTSVHKFAFGLTNIQTEKSIVSQYISSGFLLESPFSAIDPAASEMITNAIKEAKTSKPSIKVTLYGDHFSDQKSIAFLSKQGISEIVCTPENIPIVKLSAAQATIPQN